MTLSFQKLFAYLPGGKKCLPCVKGGGSRKRDGGIVKARLYHKTIPQSPPVTDPFTQGSLFYVHLCLVNFTDKHCICVHKRKYGIPLSRYTVFLKNCPLAPKAKSEEFFVFSDRFRCHRLSSFSFGTNYAINHSNEYKNTSNS